jgi:transposase
LSTKIHAVVDERGLPIRLRLSAGQASDKASAPALLEGLPVISDVVADRGYDWQHLIDVVQTRGGRAHIPTQRDRKVQRSVDRDLYRRRNLIERFFCKLKHFRRIATRYDKLARNYLAAVCLASARISIRTYESTT